MIHRPRVALVEPHDIIQALNHWGFHCQVIPQPARLRVSHECGHSERHIIPSLVEGEFLCIACIDEEIATARRFERAHINFPPLGVPPPDIGVPPPSLPSVPTVE